jgi:RNA polymerase sigma-70 factor, ECF subfamily
MEAPMQTMSMTGDTLVRSIWQNDARALLQLALRETGGDRYWAEDVVQETLVRAWRNADRLDTGKSLRPWLATVARRIIIDAHRHRDTRPHEIDDTQLEHLRADDDIEDQALVRITVRDAVQSLSPAHRDVIVELYFRGSTIDRAATALGVPAGTVRSRAYYATWALRNALAERGLRGR